MKTLTEINAAIAKIKSTGDKFDKLVHETAVSVAERFARHKDTGLVNRLFMAMPKGARSSALASWMLKYVAVLPNTDAKTKKDNPFVSAKVDGKWTKTTDALAGAQDPWYNHKPDKPVDIEFDMLTMVKAMLRKLEASTKVEHYGPEQEAALKALAASVGMSAADVPRKLVAAAVADMPEASF
jgi:hypothetical protein